MPASVIAERVGWERSTSVFRARVAELRPIYLPPDPVQRMTYVPGELAQWDFWFLPAEIPLGNGDVGSPPIWVGVSGYSRFIVAKMVPSRQTHDLLSGHLSCLIALGGIPATASMTTRAPSATDTVGNRTRPRPSTPSEAPSGWVCSSSSRETPSPIRR